VDAVHCCTVLSAKVSHHGEEGNCLSKNSNNAIYPSAFCSLSIIRYDFQHAGYSHKIETMRGTFISTLAITKAHSRHCEEVISPNRKARSFVEDSILSCKNSGSRMDMDGKIALDLNVAGDAGGVGAGDLGVLGNGKTTGVPR